MVFDFDESKALVKVADDFLRGDTPLAITQGEDERFENLSQSEAGKSTAKSKGKFIEANIRSAGSYNAYLRQKQVDRLDPVAKAKLERMLKDIDENLDDLQKEKELYQKQLGSAMSNNKSGWQSHAPSVISKFSSDTNFYAEETKDSRRLQEIDAKLLQKNPQAQELMLSQSQATPSKLTQDNLQTSKMMSETTS